MQLGASIAQFSATAGDSLPAGACVAALESVVFVAQYLHGIIQWSVRPSPEMTLMDLCQINQSRCKGCELCVKFCPCDALEMSERRNASGFHPAVLAHPELCTGCALCAEMCPETAIEVYRRKKARAS